MWLVREYSPHEAKLVHESAPFKERGDAIMYADIVARSLATLYGNPLANPILKQESEVCWLVNMDYGHSADHNYSAIKVEEQDSDAV